MNEFFNNSNAMELNSIQANGTFKRDSVMEQTARGGYRSADGGG